MATWSAERVIVYGAAATEGAVLASFCGSVSILLGRHHYELSAVQYGALFIPQVVTAVAAALVAARSVRHLPRGRVLRSGLVLSLGSLLLLIGALAPGAGAAVAFPLLLTASGLAGAGFGFVYPALLRFALDSYPARPERSVLALNLMLAVGLMVSPAVEVGAERAGIWWALAAVLSVLDLLLIAAASNARLGPDALRNCTLPQAPGRASGWYRVYPVLAVLAGACAIMLTAWAQIHRPGHAAPHPGLSTLVLAAFWAGVVALARVVFAAIDRRQTWQRTVGLVPFLLAAAVAVTGLAMGQVETATVGTFLLAALVSAAFVPLPMRPAEDQVMLLSLACAAGLIGLYPVGVGIAGPAISGLEGNGATLRMILVVTGAIGVAACLLAAGLPIWRRVVPDRLGPGPELPEGGAIPAEGQVRPERSELGLTAGAGEICGQQQGQPTRATGHRQDRLS